ncbi:hypothetical protein UlMin_014198 [Ulmus minor]
MALQAGVSSSSKVLVLVGAGLTGSIILRTGKLSDVIGHIQELLRSVNEAESSPSNYDTSIIKAQIRQLAQEIRELTLSGPVAIYNKNSTSSGSYASYILGAALLGAVGYGYAWYQGLSLSDVMFVTKQNMANAVAVVSKELENVKEALTSTKRDLSLRLEKLNWKVDEEKEMTELIAGDVTEVKSNLSKIGLNVGEIREILSGLEMKVGSIENTQSNTNSNLQYLCQVAEGLTDGMDSNKLFQDVSVQSASRPAIRFAGKSLKGLQFIAENEESSVFAKSIKHDDKDANKDDLKIFPEKEKLPTTKSRIHRSYSVGLSWTNGISGWS